MPERDPFLARGSYADGGRYDGHRSTAMPQPQGRTPEAHAEEAQAGGWSMSSLPASLRGLASGHDLQQPLLPDQRKSGKGLHFHAQSVAAMVLVPWMAFVVVCPTVAVFLSNQPIVAAAVTSFCVAVSVLFIYLHFFYAQGGPMYLYLGILGILAVSSGFTAGQSVSEGEMAQFWAQHDGETSETVYSDVAPTVRAASMSDAFVIEFREDTRIDLRRVLGYEAMDGTTYCVAPILDATQLTEVEFWAAGTNCCESRRAFKCGDALSPTANTGVVISNRGANLNMERHEHLVTAARQAASFYNLHTPAMPIFVRWANDASTSSTEHLRDGVVALVVLCLAYLIVSICLAIALHWSSAAPARSF